MQYQSTSPTRTARFAAAVQILLVPFWLLLITHWGLEIIRGVPDAYPGQHYAGLYLCIGSLFGRLASLAAHSRVRIALIVAMVAALVPALHYVFLARP